MDRCVFGVTVITNFLILYWPDTPSAGGIPHVDKVAHVAAFAAVAWAGSRALRAWSWLGALLLAHAVASELVQHFVLPGRSGSAGDVAADVLGIAIGLGPALLGGTRRHDRAGDAGQSRGAPAGGDA